MRMTMIFFDIKKIINDIEKERRDYHNKLENVENGHDKEMKVLLKEAKEILGEVYELFDDLSNGEGK